MKYLVPFLIFGGVEYLLDRHLGRALLVGGACVLLVVWEDSQEDAT
jgi:hypothetical protein